jgi:hypothetical protein
LKSAEAALAGSGGTSRRLFGMIALSMGMIDKEQLDECLQLQQQAEEPRQLGEIMLTRGDLTEDQVNDIVAVQRRMGHVEDLPVVKTEGRKLIGQIMVEAAYIDEKALRSALRRQDILRQTGISPLLGELLIAVGRLTRQRLEKALALQAMDLRSTMK